MKHPVVGIIGGSGGMGRWFEFYFKTLSSNVLIAGRKTRLTYSALARESDVVILSTPMDAAMKIAKEIGPLLREDQLLMDLCSLKEPIVKCMEENTSAKVIGTHPMFGPTTRSIEDQNVILCPARAGDWLLWLENSFKSRGARVTCMEPATHDRNMAVVQGLTHLLTICMGRTLQKMGMEPEKASDYSTPIFRLNMDLIGRLFAQDLGLYSSLVGSNKYVENAIETFMKSINEAEDLLLRGSEKDKIAYLQDIRKFFEHYCEKGFIKSNEVLKALY